MQATEKNYVALENQPYLSLNLQHGRMLFLLQKGEVEQALKLYQKKFEETEKHDFDLLHQIGLRILNHGFRKNDPECQLMALFGAGVSAHEDTYYILEESIKSRFLPIQLVALAALAHFQNDRADQAIIKALGNASVEVKFEAVHQLCKKKHPLATSQAESLMYKTPKAIMANYAPLFAMVGDVHSTRMLRKLLTQPSDEVRLAAITSISKYQRDDLLPQIRQQSAQFQYALQEACAAAMGILKDEESIPKLEKLSQSQYPHVALAAQCSLYHMGHESALQLIEEAASKENIYAIAALGEIPEHPNALLKHLESPNLQVRLNALISLAMQHHPKGISGVSEVLIRDQRNLAFTINKSPGQSFKAWKITPSASQLLKDDLKGYAEHVTLREMLLEIVREVDPPQFIAMASQIFTKQQNDLVQRTTELLEEMRTKEAIECLKKHQQQLGAPLVRHYCNLALYRLNESGPYAEQLRQWIKSQSQTELIRFKPFSPWAIGDNAYTLTPEESSQLLIKSFETFAAKQDALGVEILIEAIATGHPKNKYALAGLLLRATQ